MKLSLSTAAAPGVALDTLDMACRARGIDGLEIVIEAGDDLEALTARARASGVRFVALRADHFEDPDALARASSELAVPLSIPLGALSGSSLPDVARVFADKGGTLLIGFGTDFDQVVALTGALRNAGNPPSVGLAWELRPSSDNLEASGAVLLAARELLRLVRLYGGGPEQRDQDGRGVGPLFVDLAISGYSGPIVMTPSRSEGLPRWTEWLSSRKSAGCGAGHPAGQHEVDVRNVEPRDRLGTILGAFRALPRGATLQITLDHDPSCMYYALEDSEPAGTFAFRKIGDGPKVWHAEVTKT